MKLQRAKKKLPPEKGVERWEIEWDHGSTMYVSYPYHRTLAAAVREVAEKGANKDGYGFRLEAITIKRVAVPK